MSDTNATPPVVEAGAPAPAGVLSKLNVLLFLVAVIIGECVVAWLFVPSAADVASAAGAKPGEKKDAGKGAQAAAGEKTPTADITIDEDEFYDTDLKEVDLDTFSMTKEDITTGAIWRIDFHLFGVVHEKDVAELTARLESNKQRARECVETIFRESDEADITDARLALIKRKILAKLNEILGKSLLRGIVCGSYSYFQQ